MIERQSSAVVMREVSEFLQETARNSVRYSDGIIELTLATEPTQQDTLPPSPYGLKGGAARERVVSALGVRAPRPPRDIDVIRRGSFAIASDDAISARFMPRDYLHGSRVELIRDTKRYLATRDITLNEVGVFGTIAFTSAIAALDTVGHVIRPSYYRGGSIHRKPTLDGRVLLKMVRLAAEAEVFGDPFLLVGIPDEVSFSHFDLAIHLNKAFQRNTQVADTFVSTLITLAALPATAAPLTDLLEELEHLSHGERGLLPDVPAEYWAKTQHS